MRILRGARNLKPPSYVPVAIFGALVIGSIGSLLGLLLSPIYAGILVHHFGMPEEDVGIGVVGIQVFFAGNPNMILGGASCVALGMRKSDPNRAARISAISALVAILLIVFMDLSFEKRSSERGAFLICLAVPLTWAVILGTIGARFLWRYSRK